MDAWGVGPPRVGSRRWLRPSAGRRLRALAASGRWPSSQLATTARWRFKEAAASWRAGRRFQEAAASWTQRSSRVLGIGIDLGLV